MQLHLWGTDFRRSESEFRAKLYLPDEEREKRIREILKLGFEDIVYLHTCNRVEFVTTCQDFYDDSRKKWEKLLESFGLEKQAFYQGYHFEGKAAVRHLIRVGSSLESLVIGEPQILGQLKAAYLWSLDHKLPVSSHMQKAFHFIFNSAKKVRTESRVGENCVSVANLGLQRFEKIEKEMPLKSAVVVGRGSMSQVIIKWILNNRPEVPISWVNRHIDKLNDFTDAPKVTRKSLSEFIKEPGNFSHLFTATGSENPVFDKLFLEKLKTSCAFFDLAHPPDIEKTPSKHLVINFEQLIEEANANEAIRQQAIEQGEKIIVNSLRSYYQEQKEAPLLKDFSEIEKLIQAELESALETLEAAFPKDLTPKIELWANKLVKRNLHLSRNHLREILKKFTKAPAKDEVNE